MAALALILVFVLKLELSNDPCQFGGCGSDPGLWVWVPYFLFMGMALLTMIALPGMVCWGRGRRLLRRSDSRLVNVWGAGLLFLFGFAFLGQMIFLVQEASWNSALFVLQGCALASIALALIATGLKRATSALALVVVAATLVGISAGFLPPTTQSGDYVEGLAEGLVWHMSIGMIPIVGCFTMSAYWKRVTAG